MIRFHDYNDLPVEFHECALIIIGNSRSLVHLARSPLSLLCDVRSTRGQGTPYLEAEWGEEPREWMLCPKCVARLRGSDV